MKRIISLMLLLALSISLCACGQKEDEPLTWQEQYDLGLHYLKEGNYEEAILAFKTAIDIDPRQADAYIALAEVYVEQGKPERAARILNKAIDEIGQTDELIEARAALPLTEEGGSSAAGTAEGGSTAAGAGHIERVDSVDGSYSMCEYDSAGNLVCVTVYDADDVMQYYWINEFDAAGREVRQTEYQADGTMSSCRSYEYDEAGNLVYEAVYGADDILTYVRTFEYDSAGNLICETSYNSDGRVDHIIEYDANGTRVRYTVYYPGGNYSVDEYDSTGTLVRTTQYNADGSVAASYSYVATGNREEIPSEPTWDELLCQGTLYALDPIPDQTYFWIAWYDFAPGGTFSYKGGLYASELDTFLDGTYTLDGDDLTMNYSSGKQIRYRVSGDGAGLVLTQMSESGILFFHTAGSVQNLSPEFPAFPY